MQAIANDRGMSASSIVRTAVEMYLQREQFAVALNDVETNIASTLNASRRDTAKVSENIQLLVAIMDQFLKFSMIATPELIDREGLLSWEIVVMRALLDIYIKPSTPDAKRRC